MRSTITLIGTVLLILGIIGYSYKYFSYTSNEKVAEIGNVSVTAETEKAVIIPPVLSGLSIAAGAFLIIVGFTRKF